MVKLFLKRFILPLLSVILWTPFTVMASEIQLTDDEKAYLAEHPIIKVSNELDWPPFNYNERGQPKGFSVDFIDLVASKLGVQVEFVKGPTWEEFLDMARKRELDVLLNVVKTPDRQGYIDFTSPYLISKPSIFIPKGNKKFQNLAELNGLTVAVPKGFSNHELLARHYPDIALHLARDTQGALEAVIYGKAVAAVTDYGASNFIIKEARLDGLEEASKVADENFRTVLNLGVPKDHTVLRNLLQKGMDAITDEEMQRLRSKWLAQGTPHSIEVPIRLSSQEKAFLNQRQAISACIDPDWPPYEMFDDKGQHIGISADYFTLFSQRLPIPIRIVPTESWAETLEKAEKRECDIITLAMETEERKKHFNFSKPFITSPLVIVTSIHQPFVPDIESIGNRTIGLVRDYAFVDLLKRDYPELKIMEVDNIKQGLELVSKNQLYGMIGGLSAMGYAINQEYVGTLKISGKFEEQWALGVAVRNDAPELLSIFNKAIDRITPEQHRSIMNSWVSVHYEKVTDYTLLWNLIVFFVLIAAFFIYRHKQLHNVNKLLTDISTSDGLTGLANRIKIDEILNHCFAELERSQQTFSIMLIDIDKFKNINDQFGHQVGDDVLVKFANILRQHSREEDITGRWGGEEFLVICPNTNSSEAVTQSERIRQAVEACDFNIGKPVTISLGVTQVKSGDSATFLISRADKALYTAKHNGRNQVQLA